MKKISVEIKVGKRKYIITEVNYRKLEDIMSEAKKAIVELVVLEEKTIVSKRNK